MALNQQEATIESDAAILYDIQVNASVNGRFSFYEVSQHFSSSPVKSAMVNLQVTDVRHAAMPLTF